MTNYDPGLCDEKHTNIKDTLIDHEIRLNKHSSRLDKLEQSTIENSTEIRNLCAQIKSLVSTLKWGFGMLLTITLFVLGYLLKGGH